jgi:K+ transporter
MKLRVWISGQKLELNTQEVQGQLYIPSINWLFF